MDDRKHDRGGVLLGGVPTLSTGAAEGKHKPLPNGHT